MEAATLVVGSYGAAPLLVAQALLPVLRRAPKPNSLPITAAPNLQI